jgi:hypothetical protein
MGCCCYPIRILAAWLHLPYCWWPDPHSTGLSCTGPAVQSLCGQPKTHSLIWRAHLELDEALLPLLCLYYDAALQEGATFVSYTNGYLLVEVSRRFLSFKEKVDVVRLVRMNVRTE